MDAIAIQIVSTAILFPAQALVRVAKCYRAHPQGISNLPASKPKGAAVGRVRKGIIFDEAFGLELVRLFKDSFVVQYGPGK
jgi:hypothetical protein